MKKLFGLLALMVMLTITQSYSVTAQTPAQPETIIVNKSDLTTEQLAKITLENEAKSLEQRIQTYGKWAGSGKEIGIAIRDGLTAVVDVADKFGNTKVGTFTMYMVAWKIIGKDLVRIFIGLIFILVLIPFVVWSYKKNYTTRRICIKGNGWKFWLPKEYKIIEPDTFDGYQFLKFLHIIVIFGGFGITYAIMFG